MKRSTKVLSLILVASILISFLPGITYAATPKIVAIKDLNVSAYMNQSYTLPATVDAAMSNKTTQKVAVVWNPRTAETPQNGTFTYKGTVKGYDKQVSLTLKVMPEAVSVKGIRVVVDGKVNTFDAKLLGSEWYLRPFDIKAALGVDVAATLDGYASLRNAARMANVSYEHDGALNAAYIWTDETYEDSVSIDFDRAISLGFVPDKLKSHTERQITAKEFRDLLSAVISKLEPDKVAQFEKNVSTYSKPLLRGEGFVMAYYAAVCVGADTQNNTVDSNKVTGGDFWDTFGYEMNKLFPRCGDGPVKFSSGSDEWIDYRTAAFLWSFWHSSPYSGLTVFEYDEAAGSIRQKSPLTVKEAVEAAVRIYDSYVAPLQYVSLGDKKAVHYDSAIISDKLLNKANALPAITKEYMPSWKGFVLSQGYVYNDTDIVATGKDLQRIANWGFDSVRIMVTYQTLFDENVQSVNVTNLKKLDLLIAEAIKYNLHIDIATSTLPGRWVRVDSVRFKSTGAFDLFTNLDRQEEADRVWALLSERYKDIPDATLSFCPIWEAQNQNLSSGLPVTPYTDEDVAKVYIQLVDTIKKYNPDRFIIFEPSSANNSEHIIDQSNKTKDKIQDKYPDALLSANFCENPFVYANMTAVEGDNIDSNNHSMFKPDYPTTIYATQYHINSGSTLDMDGELVAGTKIDIYLSKVNGTGNFEILADGKTLHSESLSTRDFKVEAPLSKFYPYAKSDKIVSVILPYDVKNLHIRYAGNWFEWSGIDVMLPAKYAVKRWWFTTDYDAKINGVENAGPVLKATSTIALSPNSYNSGRIITINSDVTYSTHEIFEQSNKQTIENWAMNMFEFSPNLIVRFENAMFGIGCTHNAALKYYDDLLSTFDKYGFSWYSNDYYDILYANRAYAGVKPVQYKGFSLDVEMLKLLQKYQ